MGEEKSARYTIILGVCLLLCLLMLGRMLVGRSESEAPPDGTEPVETVPEEQQEPQLSLVMTMSESDLANFLLQYLPFTPRGRSRTRYSACRRQRARAACPDMPWS